MNKLIVRSDKTWHQGLGASLCGPDQTPQNVASDQGEHKNNISDTSRDCRTNYFKFKDKYGK